MISRLSPQQRKCKCERCTRCGGIGHSHGDCDFDYESDGNPAQEDLYTDSDDYDEQSTTVDELTSHYFDELTSHAGSDESGPFFTADELHAIEFPP